MNRLIRAVLAALAVLALTAAPAAACGPRVIATYRAGSGFYLTTNGTDGKSQPNGRVRINQQLQVTGRVSGLAASTPYVVVPYTDPYCTPLPGVTAYPSGGTFSDATGTIRPNHVPVNPAAVNPAGTLTIDQIKSVSIRQLLVSPIPLTVNGVTIPAGVPYLPATTPGVPNVAVVEGCDRFPVRR